MPCTAEGQYALCACDVRGLRGHSVTILVLTLELEPNCDRETNKYKMKTGSVFLTKVREAVDVF